MVLVLRSAIDRSGIAMLSAIASDIDTQKNHHKNTQCKQLTVQPTKHNIKVNQIRKKNHQDKTRNKSTRTPNNYEKKPEVASYLFFSIR